MELGNHITINAPKDFVASYLRTSEYFDKWQDDFKSATLLSGDLDQVSAQTRMLYKFGNSDLELLETVRNNNLPDSFEALYEHKHMDNIMLSIFKDLDGDKTINSTQVKYIELKGWIIKIMAKLFSGKFKKGPEKWMRQFKSFVESEWQRNEGQI